MTTRLLTVICLAIATLVQSPPARAEETADTYPSRTIKIIATFAPGATTDKLARIIANHMNAKWGQTVIVENRAGASGTVGTTALANATGDGYTIAVITSGLVINPNFSAVPYDPIKDFAPVILLTSISNLIVVHPSVPVKTVAEFVKFIKDNPGKYTYATSGAGGSSHVTMEYFKHVAHLEMAHVPYRGGAPAIADLIAGHIKVAMSTVPTAAPFVASGMARAIAVSRGKRSPVLPDVPTLAEAGFPDVTTAEWFGVLAPAGTPLDIRHKLNTEIARIMSLPEVKDSLAKEGIEFENNTVEQFETFVRDENDKWSSLIKAANIKTF